jgi:hypothetical protein
MPEPESAGLKMRLLSGGVSVSIVRRTLLELQEHYADLEAASLEAGASAKQAAAEARAALGTDASLAAAILARDDLKDWAHRWPRAARYVRGTALVLLLPAVPVVYCACRRASIARWSASVSLGIAITGGLLLALRSLLSV